MRWNLPLIVALGLVASPVFAQPKSKSNAKPQASAPAPSQSGSFSFSFGSSHGRLGVNASSMTDELRDYFGAPHGSGVLVQKVAPGTPGAKAGLKVGDVITQVNGKTIDTTGDVANALSDKNKGETVSLGVVRGKKALQLRATLDSDADDDFDFDIDVDGIGQLFKSLGPGTQGGTWSKSWHWSWPPSSSSPGASPQPSGAPNVQEHLRELKKWFKGLNQKQ